MEQEINKDHKEMDMSKEKDNTPFVQVDRNGDLFSNFIANFKRPFKKAEGLSLGKLFGGKNKAVEKPLADPPNIMGPIRTVFRSENRGPIEVQSVQEGKKTSQKTDQRTKLQNTANGSRRPKLN
ncbi:hypothetical protein ACM46_09980 [Chryseobacterium angstadtii]|uniref:Uncharacterized protein n=1 Tax=Chryseobacterium angstadtii TaxID=558151 RepID=A0A0J7IEM6_9FLAO|nr:hypothetical protein [Chryseobacterium angstadtii]KMQ64577.1 hypothetical protein ACM46_09980 [Chryseobacterium angstadtii]